MMADFLLAAALLVAATLLLLLRPWRLNSGNAGRATSRELNTNIYRNQLLELDNDLATGTLSSVDHAQMRLELQSRLLDDAEQEAPATAARGSRKTSLVLVGMLPIAAAVMYAWLGTAAALDPSAIRPFTQADAEKLVANLASELEKEPNDPKGWAALARSYRALGRLSEARNAFAHIGDAINTDSMLLAEYADVLTRLADGNLEGQPTALAKQALGIDPDNPLALALSATAAFDRKDFAEATADWKRLLQQVPPESDEARWITHALALVRTAREVQAPEPRAAAPVEGVGGISIRGRVSLAPALAARVKPGDTVFVFARSVQGQGMPIAVQRARAADLPFDFKLDDAAALSPERKLSGATEVRVQARISRSGSATPSPDDLVGDGPVVKPGASGVSVQIDHVRL
jgi:cytochrome c-type biogenesis protein CcmH